MGAGPPLLGGGWGLGLAGVGGGGGCWGVWGHGGGGVAPTHFGPHGRVAVPPEVGQVAGYLQGSPRWRVEVQGQGHAAIGNGWGLDAAEKFLQFGGQPGAAVIAVNNGP